MIFMSWKKNVTILTYYRVYYDLELLIETFLYVLY